MFTPDLFALRSLESQRNTATHAQLVVASELIHVPLYSMCGNVESVPYSRQRHSTGKLSHGVHTLTARYVCVL